MKLGCGETRDGNWGGPEGWFLRLRVMSEGIGAMVEDEVSGRRGVHQESGNFLLHLSDPLEFLMLPYVALCYLKYFLKAT